MNFDTTDDMDLLAFERELQSLTPAAPRRELVEAIKARMEPVPRLVQPAPARLISFPWRRMVAPAAAAAAAVAVMNLDGTRRSSKPAPVASNEPVQSVTWQPMSMLPEYRRKLDAGLVLTGNLDPETGDLEFVHPAHISPFEFFNRRVAAEQMARRLAPVRSDRYIMPAGFGTSLRW